MYRVDRRLDSLPELRSLHNQREGKSCRIRADGKKGLYNAVRKGSSLCTLERLAKGNRGFVHSRLNVSEFVKMER